MSFTHDFPDIINCRFDYLENCPSLAVLRAEILNDWLEEAGTLPPNAAAIVEREIAAWIDDAVLRHDVPWFSDGIKEELARDSVPVTKAEVLDDYFGSHDSLVEEVLVGRTPKEAAQLAADGVLFDDSITGNVAAYSPQDIMASWWRLKLI